MLLVLFAWYWSSVTLFPHAHNIDGHIYVHSHPFSGTSNNPGHSHTPQQFQLIAHLSLLVMMVATLILHTFLQLKFRVTSMRSGCAMPLPPNLPRFWMALVFLASATSLWNMEVNCLPAFKRKMRCAGGLWRRIFPEKPMYKALPFGFREIPGSASAFKPIPQSETI